MTGASLIMIDFLQSVSPAHWSIVVALGFIIALWVWFNREGANNTFQFVDAFMDDGKASSNKCLLWMFSIVAVWQVMLGTFRGSDMTTLTLGVIGVLAGAKALTQASSAFASRPAAAPSAVTATNSDISVTPAAAPAPAPALSTLPPAIRIGG